MYQIFPQTSIFTALILTHLIIIANFSETIKQSDSFLYHFDCYV